MLFSYVLFGCLIDIMLLICYIIIVVVKKLEDVYKEVYKNVNDFMVFIYFIRLGLVLNYLVFYYEIMNKLDEVCKLVKRVSFFVLLYFFLFYVFFERLIRVNRGEIFFFLFSWLLSFYENFLLIR